MGREGGKEESDGGKVDPGATAGMGRGGWIYTAVVWHQNKHGPRKNSEDVRHSPSPSLHTRDETGGGFV